MRTLINIYFLSKYWKYKLIEVNEIKKCTQEKLKQCINYYTIWGVKLCVLYFQDVLFASRIMREKLLFYYYSILLTFV